MSDPVGPIQTRPERATPRWIKITLALSLALNLLIVGVVIGAALGIDRQVRGPGGGEFRPLGLGPLALAMDRDDRSAFRDRLDLRALRRDGRTVRGAMADMQTALRADPFDRALADEALGTARAATGRMQAQGHAALLDQFAAMPLEDRIAAADRVARAMARIARRHGGSTSPAAPAAPPER